MHKLIPSILKIITISHSDSQFNTKKQDLLRMSILFCDDMEIIETLANLYVDLLNSTECDAIELLEKLVQTKEEIERTRLEHQYLCSLIPNKSPLDSISRSFNALEIDESYLPAYKLLQKTMYMIS